MPVQGIGLDFAGGLGMVSEVLAHLAPALRVYEIEREVKDLDADERHRIRQARGRPIADALHAWMIAQRLKVPEGSGTAKALNYSLKRWAALTRYLDDGKLPVDNNWVENQIRPIAVGRKNWLFAGSLRAGQRAAAVMSLIQSARLNGHDPYAYLRCWNRSENTSFGRSARGCLGRGRSSRVSSALAWRSRAVRAGGRIDQRHLGDGCWRREPYVQTILRKPGRPAD